MRNCSTPNGAFRSRGVIRMILENRLALVFVLGCCLWTSAVVAQDDMDGDLSSDSGDASDDELWERPPPDEEAPPKEEVKAPKKLMPPDGRPLQLGLGLVYGLETSARTLQGVNSYGLGLEARGAYTLDFGLSVGGVVAYFFGDTVDSGLGAGQALEGARVNSLFIGAEAGYDLWFGSFLFRPSVELGGILTFSSADAATAGGRTYFSPYFAPGVTALVMLTESVFIAGEVRLPFAMSDADNTMIFGVNGGMRL